MKRQQKLQQQQQQQQPWRARYGKRKTDDIRRETRQHGQEQQPRRPSKKRSAISFKNQVPVKLAVGLQDKTTEVSTSTWPPNEFAGAFPNTCPPGLLVQEIRTTPQRGGGRPRRSSPSNRRHHYCRLMSACLHIIHLLIGLLLGGLCLGLLLGGLCLGLLSRFHLRGPPRLLLSDGGSGGGLWHHHPSVKRCLETAVKPGAPKFEIRTHHLLLQLANVEGCTTASGGRKERCSRKKKKRRPIQSGRVVQTI